jgi:hypothetical protein
MVLVMAYIIQHAGCVFLISLGAVLLLLFWFLIRAKHRSALKEYRELSAQFKALDEVASQIDHICNIIDSIYL